MHHEKILPVHGYGGDFKDMVKMYMNGEVLYGDYWSHLKVRNMPTDGLYKFSDINVLSIGALGSARSSKRAVSLV